MKENIWKKPIDKNIREDKLIKDDKEKLPKIKTLKQLEKFIIRQDAKIAIIETYSMVMNPEIRQAHKRLIEAKKKELSPAKKTVRIIKPKKEAPKPASTLSETLKKKTVRIIKPKKEEPKKEAPKHRRRTGGRTREEIEKEAKDDNKEDIFSAIGALEIGKLDPFEEESDESKNRLAYGFYVYRNIKKNYKDDKNLNKLADEFKKLVVKKKNTPLIAEALNLNKISTSGGTRLKDTKKDVNKIYNEIVKVAPKKSPSREERVLSKAENEKKIKKFGTYQKSQGTILAQASIILKENVDVNKLINYAMKNPNDRDINIALESLAETRQTKCEKNVKFLQLAIDLKKKKTTWAKISEFNNAKHIHKTKKNFLNHVSNLNTSCFTKAQLNKLEKLGILKKSSYRKLEETIKIEKKKMEELRNI